jgi:hypothetical protein
LRQQLQTPRPSPSNTVVSSSPTVAGVRTSSPGTTVATAVPPAATGPAQAQAVPVRWVSPVRSGGRPAGEPPGWSTVVFDSLTPPSCRCATVTPSGRSVCCSSAGRASSKPPLTFVLSQEIYSMHAVAVRKVRYSAGGSLLASAAADGSVRIRGSPVCTRFPSLLSQKLVRAIC